MKLRNNKIVGENHVLDKCLCKRGYWACTVFRRYCSLCYREKYSKRIKWQMAMDNWLFVRDQEAQEKRVDADCIQRIQMFMRRNRVLELLIELETQKKHGKYLLFDQVVYLYHRPTVLSECEQVHILFPFVYDRWNVTFQSHIPTYSVCYYGNHCFWSRRTFEESMDEKYAWNGGSDEFKEMSRYAKQLVAKEFY